MVGPSDRRPGGGARPVIQVSRRVVLLSAAAVMLTLVAVEVALRLVAIPSVEIHRRAGARASNPRFFEHEPHLGWRGRASAHGAFAGWEFDSHVRLNAHGFRDVELEAVKPPGVSRIVLLGDSITWGHGVEASQRFGDRVAAVLRRRGERVQVVNLAVSGYGTDQELLLWQREGPRHCADLVLLGLYENDVRENAAAFQGHHPKPYFRLSDDRTLTLENVPVPRVADEPVPPPRAGVPGWMRSHLRIWAVAAFLREAVRGHHGPPPVPPEVPPGSVELTAALIRRLGAEVRGAGSAFGLVVLPDVLYAASSLEAAAGSGVEARLDLAPSFRRAEAVHVKLFYRLDGAHWTAAAHAVAANAIAEWIVAAKLLPASPRVCGR